MILDGFRCVDPTELGSYLSSMRCQADESCQGDVIPVTGSDFEVDDWQCTECKSK